MPDTAQATTQPKGRTFTDEERRRGQLSQAAGRRSKLGELVEIQSVMKVLSLDPALKALERSSAARVWKELELLRRVTLGKANPAPAKVEPKKARSRSPAAPVDT